MLQWNTSKRAAILAEIAKLIPVSPPVPPTDEATTDAPVQEPDDEEGDVDDGNDEDEVFYSAEEE
jgi:hypothetical protein